MDRVLYGRVESNVPGRGAELLQLLEAVGAFKQMDFEVLTLPVGQQSQLVGVQEFFESFVSAAVHHSISPVLRQISSIFLAR